MRRDRTRLRYDGSASEIASLNQRLIDSLKHYAIFALSVDGNIISWNAGATHTFGYSADEVLGKPYSLLFTAEDVALGRPAAELRASREQHKESVDGWHVRKDATRFWCTDTIQTLRDADGTISGFTKIVHDTTEAHLAQERLRESEERLRLLVEGVTEYALFSIDPNGLILLWNSGAERLFGFAASEVVGKHFSLTYAAEAIARGIPDTELAEAAKSGFASDEAWRARRDGEAFFARGQMTRLKDDDNGNPRGFVKICHDVTEEHESAIAVRRQAFHDELTQLPNRAMFCDHVRRSIALRKRHPEKRFGVIFLDLDRFKNINDSVGHVVADNLLVQVARILERCVRTEDVVARMGGDEFTILITELREPAEALRVAERIHAALQAPLHLDGLEVFTTASMGIAVSSSAYDEPDQILRDADTAMYEAKALGRSTHVLFGVEMHARAVALLQLQTDLRRAITRNEFFVEYQPIVSLETCRVIGFEALVRWNHPLRGTLQPADFIAEAEGIGLITQIDRLVLYEACRQLRAWQVECDDDSLTVSVNVSSQHFAHDDVLVELQDALQRHVLAPHSLKLEITETSLMEQYDTVAARLSKVTELGVELSIDDFGTGYSSLSYLAKFPLTSLKVDRSFVNEMSLKSRGVAIANTVVTLAHNMGLAAIAEGIETEEQLEALQTLGCDFGQGFWFSRPVGVSVAQTFIGRALPLQLRRTSPARAHGARHTKVITNTTESA